MGKKRIKTEWDYIKTLSSEEAINYLSIMLDWSEDESKAQLEYFNQEYKMNS